MSKLVIVSRIAGLALLLGGMQSACGGQSFGTNPEPSGGNGNQGATGGTSDAGKGHGGSVAAGSGTGGTSSGGNGSAGNGSAGAPPDDPCSGPPTIDDSAGCSAAFRNWTHDSKTGLCRPILYGGCGASQNNYKTLEECQKACPNGDPNYDACTKPTDCMLASPGCCGVCDGPSVTSHDFVAYNKKYADQGLTCAGDVACGACPPPEGEPTLHNFLPNCVQKQCVVEDLRTSAVTACKTDTDCRVRSGTGCCPGCGNAPLIAVRNDSSFEDLVCGDLLPPCAACEQPIDPNVVAQCGQSGHCELVYLAVAP